MDEYYANERELIDDETREQIADDRYRRSLGGMSTLFRPRDLHSEAGKAWIRAESERRLRDLQRSVAITDWPAPLRSLSRDGEEEEETESTEIRKDRR